MSEAMTTKRLTRTEWYIAKVYGRHIDLWSRCRSRSDAERVIRSDDKEGPPTPFSLVKVTLEVVPWKK